MRNQLEVATISSLLEVKSYDNDMAKKETIMNHMSKVTSIILEI